MPQSLVKNYIHLIFSTKNREHFIQPKFEQELHAYLGAVCNKLDCKTISVGGHTNHVHLLFLLSQKKPLMEIVQKIKANSSKWMKTRAPELENFFWQEGYGAFSVSHKNVEGTIQYIQNQHIHHENQDFKDELRFLMRKHEVDFDERYVWD